jgi:hypothetical protein
MEKKLIVKFTKQWNLKKKKKNKVKVLASCHIIQFLGKFSILPFYTPASRRGRGVYCFTSARLSVRPSIQDNFLSNCWWQKSDIWSQASCRYTILWVAFLDLSDSYFLFADLVGFYTHWTYMYIFLSNYWWQKSYIWSQASYRYPLKIGGELRCSGRVSNSYPTKCTYHKELI